MKPIQLTVLCGILLALLAADARPQELRPPAPTRLPSLHQLVEALPPYVEEKDGVLHAGSAQWKATLDADGVVFFPRHDVDAAVPLDARFQFVDVRRGDQVLADHERSRAGQPTVHEQIVIYRHSETIHETFEARLEGLKQSFVFSEPLAGSGDLVARVRIETPLMAEHGLREGEELAFANGADSILTIGQVVGIDADGTQETGTLNFDGEYLEFRLPESFVDEATYPLVLDPIVGPGNRFSISQGDNLRPDIAYDVTNDLYLVVWEYVFSSSDRDVYCVRVRHDGSFVGNIISIETASTDDFRPRVANVLSRESFYVVWESEDSGLHSIWGRAVRADTGSRGDELTIHAGFNLPPLHSEGVHPDVCGEQEVGDDCQVVYEESVRGEIWSAEVQINPDGTSRILRGNQLGNAIGTGSKPRTCTSGGTGRQLLVVWEEANRIKMRAMDMNSNLLGTERTRSSSSASSASVDGNGSEFLVVWRETPTPGVQELKTQQCSYDSWLGGLLFSPQQTIRQGPDLSKPSVAYIAISPSWYYAATWAEGNSVKCMTVEPYGLENGAVYEIASGADAPAISGASAGRFPSNDARAVVAYQLTSATTSHWELGSKGWTSNVGVPTVTSVSPNTLIASSSPQTITVRGSGFNLDSDVVRNFLAGPRATLVNETTLNDSVTVPTAGTYRIWVENGGYGGGLSNEVTLTVNNPVPVLGSISPSSRLVGSGGFTLTANGSQFNQTSVVRWNSTNLATTYLSSGILTASVPAGLTTSAGAATITVFTPSPGGGTSSGRTCTIRNPTPTITSLSPNLTTWTPSSFTLTVRGTDFVPGVEILRSGVNGPPLPTTWIDSTRVSATVHYSRGTTQLFAVRNPSPGGGTSNELLLTVNNPVPSLGSISPTGATVGSGGFTLTVNGDRFNPGSVVRWNGSDLPTTLVSVNVLRATVDASLLQAPNLVFVTVVNEAPGGGSSGSIAFEICPQPAIGTLTPDRVRAGSSGVTISATGSEFQAGGTFEIDGQPVSTNVLSSQQATFDVPAPMLANQGTLQVTFVNPCGTNEAARSNAVPLIVDCAMPTITRLDPERVEVGAPGVTLQLHGRYFDPGATIYVDGQQVATSASITPTLATVNVPASLVERSGERHVVIVNPCTSGPISSSPASFAVTCSTFGDETVITALADGAEDVHAADLDGDGDLDVLSASSIDHTIAWYANQGDGTFGGRTPISTTALRARSVTAADLDGDGNLDVLSASSQDDKIAWYRNLGGGSFGTEQILSSMANGAFRVDASDVDGDGDVDVLSASFNDDKIAWYQNQGGGVFGAENVITSGATGTFDARFFDLDGDGRRDVLAGYHTANRIAWFRNLGGGSFSSELLVSAAVMGPEGIFAADLDGDGDLDVLSASSGDQEIAWYENTGGGTFGLRHVLGTQQGPTSVFATDVDGDGDVDVLATSSADDTIAWYQNLAFQAFGPRQVITSAAVGAEDAYLADIDGDGSADLLAASRGDDTIAWYKNLTNTRGQGVVVAWGSRPLAYGRTSAPAVLTPPAGTTYVEMAAGSEHTLGLRDDGRIDAWAEPTTTFPTSAPSLPPGMTYVDVDAGRYQSAAVRSDGQLVFWGNPTSWGGSLPTEIIAPPPGLSFVEVAAGRTHALARLNDGSLIGFGDDTYGQASLSGFVPYAQVSVSSSGVWSLGLHVDGSLSARGVDLALTRAVEAVPAGIDFIAVSAGHSHGMALRQDGSIVLWGDASAWGGSASPEVIVAPTGFTYVEIAAGGSFSMARRSDDSVVLWGGGSTAPVVARYGQACRGLAAGTWNAFAHWGPVVDLVAGCGLGGRLSVQCDPVLGTTHYQELRGANGGTTSASWWLLAVDPSTLPLSCPTCPFLVGSVIGFSSVPMANGEVTVPAALDWEPGWIGLTLYSQFATFTPGNPNPCGDMFGFSNIVSLTIGL